MLTKYINNTIFIMLIILVAFAVFVIAKLRYKGGAKKESEEKPKLSKYIISALTAVSIVIGIFASNAGHFIFGKILKHNYSLIIEYDGSYDYKNKIDSDILAIQNRIDLVGMKFCGFKKDNSKIAILYRGTEEIPDYIIRTLNRLEEDNVDKDIIRLFDECDLSANLNIVHNVIGSNKYNEFINRKADEEEENVSKKNEQETVNVDNDKESRKELTFENKTASIEEQESKANSYVEKKETGSIQNTKEQYTQIERPDVYKENEIPDNKESLKNNTESGQSVADIGDPVEPPTIDSYDPVEPPSLY